MAVSAWGWRSIAAEIPQSFAGDLTGAVVPKRAAEVMHSRRQQVDPRCIPESSSTK